LVLGYRRNEEAILMVDLAAETVELMAPKLPKRDAQLHHANSISGDMEMSGVMHYLGPRVLMTPWHVSDLAHRKGVVCADMPNTRRRPGSDQSKRRILETD
jgi:hypothetical protein